MSFHNTGKSHFTKKGVPWKVITTFEFTDKAGAMILEKQIKKNGAKRYLERNNIIFSI